MVRATPGEAFELMTHYLIDCCINDNYPVFSRTSSKDTDGNEQVSLADLLSRHRSEFDLWCYLQKWQKLGQAPRGRLVLSLIVDVAAGYLDGKDWMSAVDTLSAPNIANLFPGVDIVVRLFTLAMDETAPEQALDAFYHYLRRLFESQQIYQLLPDMLSKASISWSSLSRLIETGSSSTIFQTLSLLLLLFRDEMVSKYPNFSESCFCKFAGLDLYSDDGPGRSRRGEDTFGNFVMSIIKRPTQDSKVLELAHEFLELGYMCVIQTGSQKHFEIFLNDFYDSSLLRNTSPSIQSLFFNTSSGTFVSQQLAYLVLQRKFGLGSGPVLKGTSPHAQHLSLLGGVLKLGKTKVNLERDIDRLQFAAFNAAIHPFFSPQLSTFPLGSNSTRIPWLTVAELGEIKALVSPVMKRKDKAWNPYLIPYRILFGKDEIEVIVISSGTSSSASDTEVIATPDGKSSVGKPVQIGKRRVPFEPIEID